MNQVITPPATPTLDISVGDVVVYNGDVFLVTNRPKAPENKFYLTSLKSGRVDHVFPTLAQLGQRVASWGQSAQLIREPLRITVEQK